MPKASNKWLALSVTSLGTFMSCVNNSSVTVANPVLAAEFAIALPQVQWVATVYSVVICSLMVLMGRIGDRVGSHRVYLCGVGIFMAGSLLSGLAPYFWLLLAARAITAIGGSMMVATSMGLVSSIFPVEQRGMALGFNMLVVGLGNFAGPTIAGAVLTYLSWHWIFLLNAPIAIIVLAMGAFWLRSPLEPQKGQSRLDYAGAALLMACVASLVMFLSAGTAYGPVFLVASIALLAALVWREKTCDNPLIAIELFKNKRFTYGNLISFFIYMANSMMQFQLPFFMEQVWNIPVGMVGIIMVTQALVMAIVGPIAGALSDKIGAMRIMPWAILLYIVSFAGMLFLPSERAVLMLVCCMALTGFGAGMLNTPNNSEIMSAAGRKYSGYASGFVGTNRQLAFSIGMGASAGIFSFLHSATLQTMGDPSAYMFSFRALVLFSVACGFVSLLLWWRTNRYLKKQQ